MVTILVVVKQFDRDVLYCVDFIKYCHALLSLVVAVCCSRLLYLGSYLLWVYC